MIIIVCDTYTMRYSEPTKRQVYIPTDGRGGYHGNNASDTSFAHHTEAFRGRGKQSTPQEELLPCSWNLVEGPKWRGLEYII